MRTAQRLLAVIAVATLTAAPFSGGTAFARPSVVTPTIEDAVAVHAPIGKKGGILTPYVGCSDFDVDPHVTSSITNTKTGWKRSYTWTGALPGYGFPRVAVGLYEVRTKATCASTTKVRTEKVRVKEKTRAHTVSKAEWHKIKRGMTAKQVAKIVGYNGRDSYRYDGKVSRIYDMMDFWAWSIIEYRHSRVVSKQWNVGHD